MKERRKIPNKAELLQLQRLYKTDERIGERLGGVPAYLVAYWRRKKNIPKYSLPKFSQAEIRNLWERFGDDEKAGLELGISKAAFYNWRRRYGFREKPAFLKLEQLELNFPGSKVTGRAASLYGKRTMAQKILARVAGRDEVAVGELVEAEPDVVMVHGSAREVIEEFRALGAEYIWNPGRVVMTQNRRRGSSEGNVADGHKRVREFVKRQRIKACYNIRDGIGPQVVVEKGHVLPGQLVLGTGHGVAAYGSLGALATVIRPAEMAGLWSSGKCSMQVPGTVRIIISGRRYRGVFGQDIALFIIDSLGAESVQGKAIEYAGSVVSQMTVSERMTLANLSPGMGIVAAICPYDGTTRRYLTGRAASRSVPVLPDKDAEYEGMYQINIDHLVPQVARTSKGEQVKPATELEGLAVHQVVVGSCSSGRFDELRAAADILKGKQIHPDCRMLVIPGSQRIYLEALKKGLIRVFVEAGAMIMHPGCCLCQGTDLGKLADGERCLSATDPHLADHIVSANAEVCLCSPATAAASALNAAVTDPTRYLR